MKEDFAVPMNGLAQGRTEFRLRVGKEFFEQFENSEILDADIEVGVTVEKSGRFTGVDCTITGNATVTCDRCLEDLKLPVETGFSLSVKFGQEPSDEGNAVEGGREIVWLPESDAELDLAQIVYDYVCLSFPVQRVHPEGECNPETLKYLSSEDCSGKDSGEEGSERPFAALKDLIEGKK